MNVNGLGMDDIEGVLGAINGFQEKLTVIAPLVSTVAPKVGDLTISVLGAVVEPAVKELHKVVRSKEMTGIVTEAVAAGAVSRTKLAKARLAKNYRESVDLESRVSAENAKSQVEAYMAVGFTRAQSIKLYEQKMIADAIRYTKSTPSYPNFSSSDKSGK